MIYKSRKGEEIELPVEAERPIEVVVHDPETRTPLQTYVMSGYFVRKFCKKLIVYVGVAQEDILINDLPVDIYFDNFDL